MHTKLHPILRARKEHRIFTLLTQAVPGLEALLFKEPSQEDILHMADLVSPLPSQLSPDLSMA